MANDKKPLDPPEPPGKPDDVSKGPPIETEGGGDGEPPKPPKPGDGG